MGKPAVARGGGGGGKSGKPAKLGSKARRAAKLAADAGPRAGESLLPRGGGDGGGGGVARGGALEASAVDPTTIDWDKVSGWSRVKYDPNRLILGAQEEGFVELEEIDMADVDVEALIAKSDARRGAPEPGAAPGKPASADGGFETTDLASRDDRDDGDFDEDLPGAFDDDEPNEAATKAPPGGGDEPRERERKKKERKKKDEGSGPGSDLRGSGSDPAASGSGGKALTAKEARIEKRKARWKAKVEAAKARKAEAKRKAAAANEAAAAGNDRIIDRGAPTGDSSPSPPRGAGAGAGAGAVSVPLDSSARGAAKAEGWHMDYNNYPTSGMGAVVDGVDLDRGADVSAWLEFDLHPALLRALQELGFATPTPIQRECLNPAIKGRCDVIGAAETGSGKTLAFGLPILNRLLTQRDEEAEASESDSEEPDANDPRDPSEANRSLGEPGGDARDDDDDPFAALADDRGRSGADAGTRLKRRRRALRALIVAPTRELAMQVSEMLASVARHADVSVVPVVGGMSAQKQERLLARRPEVVVATPGRLWELMNERNHEHFADLGRLQFLVLDEADRMVERGHFAELANVIEALPMPPRVARPRGAAKATPETLKIFKRRGADREGGEGDAGGGKRGGKGRKGGNAPAVEAEEEPPETLNLRPSQMLDRQTFVFSATLTVPDAVRRKLKKGQAKALAEPTAPGRDGKNGDARRWKKNKDAAAGDLNRVSANEGNTLGALMEAVPFYGRVKLVDLTDPTRTVAKRVAESALECTEVRAARVVFPSFFFPVSSSYSTPNAATLRSATARR
jgi:ATP-dependent RNA helicase DDX24/MAK5